MRHPRAEHLQIRYKPSGCIKTGLLYGALVDQRPIACLWHKERFYTAGPVPQSGWGILADGKPRSARNTCLLGQVGT